MIKWYNIRGGSRGRVEGVAPPPPFRNFSNLSGYPCLSLFHTKTNITSYNISSSPIDYYKKTVAIPLLDTLIIQMQDRFSDEDRHAHHLLFLVPSIMVNKALQLDDEVEGMLLCEKEIPFLKSLGNKVHRWKRLRQSTDRELPNKLLLGLGVCDEDALPNIYCLLVIACTLPITSAEVELSFSLMKWIKTCSRSTMLEACFSGLAVIAMYYSERFEVDEICQAFVKAHTR